MSGAIKTRPTICLAVLLGATPSSSHTNEGKKSKNVPEYQRSGELPKSEKIDIDIGDFPNY